MVRTMRRPGMTFWALGQFGPFRRFQSLCRLGSLRSFGEEGGEVRKVIMVSCGNRDIVQYNMNMTQVPH